MHKRKNDALKLMKKQLNTQLNKKNKLLVINNKEVQQLRREHYTCEAERVHA